MEKSQILEHLHKLLAEAAVLHPHNDVVRERWIVDAKIVLEHLFGANSRQLADFKEIPWRGSIRINDQLGNQTRLRNAQINGHKAAIIFLEATINEVLSFWPLLPPNNGVPAVPRIERIADQFHEVVRQLRRRHDSRETLNVTDEYDLQDLLHAILLLDFEDIRAEEWTPSYAGGCARMDFLLKREQVVIEAKHGRKSLTAKLLGDELIVDGERYQSHPDCRTLVCFVYDPDGWITNPRGIENDLSKDVDDFQTRVMIRP